VTIRGLPISCFLNEASDSLEGITNLWEENVWLAARGGGIGSYWGNLRSIGEKIGKVGKTSGIIPFIKVMDSLTLAISQGSLRRGSAACYLQIDHPEIEEFIEMRRPTGGDPNRKSLNLHHGVLVSDAFMRAVELDEQWGLKSPKDGAVQATVSARNLWIRLLTARIETGEPYIVFIDTVNRQIPQHHKLAGLNVKTSNLCSEITLPTGIDKDGRDRTAVCCLSSWNLEKYDAKFLKKINLRFIVLCENLYISEINTAGIPDYKKRTLILDINFEKKYFERVIHHEIFHLVYDSFKEFFNDKTWSDFNKKSFKYAECSTCSDRLNLDLYDNTDGFVTEYSKSIPSEDMAEVFSFLIFDRINLENKSKNDPILLNKINYIKSGLDKINKL